MALKPKIPVITILGHVDHGKTTLLDALRSSQVAQSESGGITQHIGAYQLTTQVEGQKHTLTFIDTPGHAAFEKMRSRGAKAADIAILLIDAKEGVMPQTKEAIRHIQKAQVPFLVCLNKIDLAGADPQKVKQQLAEQSVFVEGYGGDIVTVGVSAKNKTNLVELLQMLVLINQLDPVKADPQAPLQTLVIESQLDKNRGCLATLLVQSGTLKGQDQLFDSHTTQTLGKVRLILDENGKKLEQITPGQAAQVCGFKAVPPVGSLIATSVSKSASKSASKSSAPIFTEEDLLGKRCLIVKADAQGTLQAVVESVPQDFVVVNQGIGPVSESDVLLAQATPGTQIIAFNVTTTAAAKKIASIEKISIFTHTIIYRLLEFLENQLKKAQAESSEQVLGQAVVLKIFPLPDFTVIGCQVTQGKFIFNQSVKVIHQDQVLGTAKIVSLKQGNQKADQVKAGQEAGLILNPHIDCKPKNVIICYQNKTKENENSTAPNS